jgi:hypothetical protein
MVFRCQVIGVWGLGVGPVVYGSKGRRIEFEVLGMGPVVYGSKGRRIASIEDQWSTDQVFRVQV